MLSEFLSKQPGKRLSAFQALQFLNALVVGLEQIHYLGEYHGDLHEENFIVSRYGLGFELKLLDTYDWSDSNRSNLQSELIDIIKIFHYVPGGAKHYARQPDVLKEICCGLKHSLIVKKFRNVTRIKEHLEQLSWE